jgi:hypothetical protein
MERGRRWLVGAAACIVAVASLSACGDSKGGKDEERSGAASAAASDESGSPVDGGATAAGGEKDGAAAEPCEIVTTVDIESAVGTGPVREGELTGNTCSWPVGDGGAVGISLTDTADHASTAEEAVVTMRDGLGGDAVEVAGVGDEAVGDGAGMLAFRSGEWYVTVGVYTGSDGAEMQAAAEALAQLVNDRL